MQDTRMPTLKQYRGWKIPSFCNSIFWAYLQIAPNQNSSELIRCQHLTVCTWFEVSSILGTMRYGVVL